MNNICRGRSSRNEAWSGAASRSRVMEMHQLRLARSAMNNAIERYERRFTEMLPDEYEAYVSLGLEIVNQSVKDYRNACNRLKEDPKSRRAKKLKEDAVLFL